MVTHVLLLRLNEPSPTALAECVAKMEAMNRRLPAVRSFEVGINTRETSRSYEIAVIVRVDDLDQYLREHDEAPEVDYVRSVMSEVATVDFSS